MRPTLTIGAILAMVVGSFAVAGPKEVRRGNYWDAILRDGLPLYEEEEVNARVTEVGRKIVAASGNPHGLEFHFFILNSSEPTAFAAPGGTLYLTTALLQNLTSEDELAAVIAHEVGHVNEKHGMKVGMGSGSKKFWSTLIYVGATAASVYLGTVVADSLPADYTVTAQQNVFELTAMAVRMGTSVMGHMVVQSFYKGYQEKFEFEADELALDYSRRADYRPEALIDVFERLGGAASGQSTGISQLHSSRQMLIERGERARLELSQGQ